MCPLSDIIYEFNTGSWLWRLSFSYSNCFWLSAIVFFFEAVKLLTFSISLTVSFFLIGFSIMYKKTVMLIVIPMKHTSYGYSHCMLLFCLWTCLLKKWPRTFYPRMFNVHVNCSFSARTYEYVNIEQWSNNTNVV